eukprot:Opistho-1_new@91751
MALSMSALASQRMAERMHPLPPSTDVTPARKPSEHVACLNCRDAHRKCNGTSPCQPCMRFGLCDTCSYVPPGRKGRKPNPRTADGTRRKPVKSKKRKQRRPRKPAAPQAPAQRTQGQSTQGTAVAALHRQISALSDHSSSWYGEETPEDIISALEAELAEFAADVSSPQSRDGCDMHDAVACAAAPAPAFALPATQAAGTQFQLATYGSADAHAALAGRFSQEAKPPNPFSIAALAGSHYVERGVPAHLPPTPPASRRSSETMDSVAIAYSALPFSGMPTFIAEAHTGAVLRSVRAMSDEMAALIGPVGVVPVMGEQAYL